METKTAIIVPARFGSKRFPGKPLTLIRGCDGIAKPLIQHSYDAARRAAGDGDTVHVATDDDRIADAVRGFGGSVLMTPQSCANGTERVAACLDQLDDDIDLLVNFQGDALLTAPALVQDLHAHMLAAPMCAAATVAVHCSAQTYAHLAEDAAQGRVGGTTVVCAADGHALYFSKRILPFIAPDDPATAKPPVLLHVGLYAYRRAALATYIAAGPTQIEQLEGLEQLRFLVHGVAMYVVQCPPPAWAMVEVNNPQDVPIVERLIAEHGIGA